MSELSLREAREKAGYSLRKAAELLGISHAYLSGLELGHKPLNKSRALALSKLYGVKNPKDLQQPLPQDKEEFIGWLQNQIKWWDSRFVLPMIPAVSRLISDISIDPSFLLEDNTIQTKDQLLNNFLTNKKNQALLLQGKIGTGKSFFMKMLCLELDKICTANKLTGRYVPMLVSLGEFTLIRGAAVQSLAQYYKANGFPGSVVQLETFIFQCFERGNALLLLDGLDEIRDHKERVAMLALIQQHFEDFIRPTGSRLIITGREDAFFERDRNYTGFALVRMEQWHTTQMYQACIKWSFEDEEQTNRFFNILQANDNLYRLAKWPLLFHLLTTIYSASGLKPFQELTGLCDDCCQVLENTWDSARRTFTRQQEEDLLVMHPWLKWRHFLIHLIQKCLNDAIADGTGPKFRFSAIELKDAWEAFLADKGVSRKSIDFARLEDLFSNQNRIGPMFHYRDLQSKGKASGTLIESFAFLDRIFGLYYYSKALTNQPDRLESFILQYLRSVEWEDVIPLVLEELGRSERTYENDLGARLIKAMLRMDDELKLEEKYKVGNFALFAAMRAIPSYNLESYWDLVLEPFIDVYMNSIYERDGTLGNEILGEYSASNKLKAVYLDKFENLFHPKKGAKPPTDDRWRILAALGRFGEKADFIVKEFNREIISLIKNIAKVTVEEKINLRRILWSIREVRGLFTLADNDTQNEPSAKTEQIEKIQDGILEFFEVVKKDIVTEVKQNIFKEFGFWDVMTVALDTQYYLGYRSTLRSTINDVVTTAVEHDILFSVKYPHRDTFLQFLKAAARHSYFLEQKLAEKLLKKLKACRKDLAKIELVEVELIVGLIERQQQLSDAPLDGLNLYEDIYGPVDIKQYREWVDTIKKQKVNSTSNLLAIGFAAWGISTFHSRFKPSDKNYSSQAVVKALLAALDAEMDQPEYIRDGQRTYTAPFSNYGFPLYDHIYNSIVAVARSFPLKESRG